MKITFPGCHSQWHACHRALFCLPLPGRVGRARMALQPEKGGGRRQQGQALFPNQDLAGTQHRSPGLQKAAHHLPNSSSPSSEKSSGSACLPSVLSAISCGLGLPLRL